MAFNGNSTGQQESLFSYNSTMASTDTIRIISSLQSRQITYASFVTALESSLAALGRKTKVRTVSSSQSVLVTDEVVGMDTTGGNRTLELPSAADTAVWDATSLTSRRYTLKKNDTASNTLTITTSGSQTIDGASTYALTGTSSPSIAVVSNGSNWLVVT